MKLSHPSLSVHVIIRSYHRLQHSPSTVYTAYCIIPNTTVCHSQRVLQLFVDHVVLNTLHSQNYESTNEWSLICCHASLPNYRLQIDHHQRLLESSSIRVSQWISKFAQSWPPSASPITLNHCHKVYLQTCSIKASKFATSWPPGSSPHSHDSGLQVHHQPCSVLAFNCTSKLTWLWPPSSLEYGLQVHNWSHSIMTLECITQFTWSWCCESVELEGR